jgi:hypothetical protein
VRVKVQKGSEIMRVIPGVLSWFTAIFIVIFAPKPLSAQNNETPRNKHAWWIEPYACWGGTSDQWSDCDSAVIDNECCYGGTFCGWRGARVSFGPPDTVTIWEIIQNLRGIWEGLDGQRGKDDRVAGHAYLDANPQTLSMCGNGHTTLAPAVKDYYPPTGFAIDEDSVGAWVAFDTEMDINSDPEKLVFGSDGAFVKDQRWVRGERDTLRFTLRSVRVNDECFAVLGHHLEAGDTLKSEGGMALDGNLNPDGSDGEGPNRDAFAMPCDCRYHDPNYAAALGFRWAYYDGRYDAGWQQVRWSGRNADGRPVAPGMYFARVETRNRAAGTKIILMK